MSTESTRRRPEHKAIYRPYKKGRYLQAQYRFVVLHDPTAPNQSRLLESNLKYARDPEANIEWTQVLEVIEPSLAATAPAHCPICLTNRVAPQVLKCGHSYCWSCINRVAKYSQPPSKCPVCNNWFMLYVLIGLMPA